MKSYSLRILSVFVTASLVGASSPSSPFSQSKKWGIQVVGSIPRGGDASYTSLCEDVKGSITQRATQEVRFFTLLLHEIYQLACFDSPTFSSVVIIHPKPQTNK